MRDTDHHPSKFKDALANHIHASTLLCNVNAVFKLVYIEIITVTDKTAAVVITLCFMV